MNTRAEFAAELARRRSNAELSLADLALQAHVRQEYAHHVESHEWPVPSGNDRAARPRVGASATQAT
jgi:hypothetical protein